MVSVQEQTQTQRHIDKHTQTHKHTDRQTHAQTHTQTHKHTQAHKHTDRHTHRHTDTHTQTDRHTDRRKDTHTHINKQRNSGASPSLWLLMSRMISLVKRYVEYLPRQQQQHHITIINNTRSVAVKDRLGPVAEVDASTCIDIGLNVGSHNVCKI